MTTPREALIAELLRPSPFTGMCGCSEHEQVAQRVLLFLSSHGNHWDVSIPFGDNDRGLEQCPLGTPLELSHHHWGGDDYYPCDFKGKYIGPTGAFNTRGIAMLTRKTFTESQEV